MPNINGYSGTAFFWDNFNLRICKYNNAQMLYYCGNKLLELNNKTILYTLLLFDLREYTIAKIYSDNSFQIINHKTSLITNKHRQGGQSSQRFERGRDNLITLWFKKINETMTNIDGPIKIGSHEFYQKRFEEKLSEENKKKIIEFFNSEYCDESGVQQFMNKIR